MADKSLPPLTEVAMWRIFNNLPTVDLLSTDRVSTSWSAFTQRETTLNRKSLTLFLGEPKPRCLLDKYGQSQEALVNNKFDMPYMGDLKNTTTGGRLFPDFVPPLAADTLGNLAVKELTDDLIEQLLELFPKLTRLVVSTAPGAFTEPLLDLLIAWSGTLTSFKLYTAIDPLPKKSKILFPQAAKRLLYIINSMSSLKHLEVQWGDRFLSKKGGQLDMPILAHLEEFYFYSEDDALSLAKSLSEYGLPNRSLRVVALPGYLQNKHHLGFALSPPFMNTRIKQLNISLRGEDHAWFEYSPLPTPYFAALTILELDISPNDDLNYAMYGDRFTFADFLHYLVPLKRLLSLKVTLSTGDVDSFHDDLWDMKTEKDFKAIEDSKGNWLTVPSVKVLSLDFVSTLTDEFGQPSDAFGKNPINSHYDLAALELHRFFPSVQVLQLNTNEKGAFACNACVRKYKKFKEWEDACIPRMVNSARHFKDLISVGVSAMAVDYCDSWDADELEDDEWITDDDDSDDY